jgi:ribosomal protein S12 methylthiotransferase accessory factor
MEIKVHFLDKFRLDLDEDLALADYEANFRRMFGDERMNAAIGSAKGSSVFTDLTQQAQS